LTMTCRARLSWRSPKGLSRCRVILPEDASSGLTRPGQRRRPGSGTGRGGTRKPAAGRRLSGRHRAGRAGRASPLCSRP
jgi:hypothetical protein